MNALSAIENQKVLICRLSHTNKELIEKALDIAWNEAVKMSSKTKDRQEEKQYITLANTIGELERQIKKGKEIWLIES